MRNFKWRLFLRKRNCGNSSHSILCETEELQVTDCLLAKAELLNFETYYIPCAEAKLRNFKSQDILCAEAELRDLKSKLLYAKLQLVLNLLYGSVNCVTTKPQYFPSAEAELRHFRVPSHTLFCMRKRNCGTLSLSIFLMRRGTSSQRIVHVWKCNCRTSSHIIVCVRKRNFKSHKSLYVESLWFLMQ